MSNNNIEATAAIIDHGMANYDKLLDSIKSKSIMKSYSWKGSPENETDNKGDNYKHVMTALLLTAQNELQIQLDIINGED